MTFRYGSLFVSGFTAFVLLLDVAINALMAHAVPSTTSTNSSNIGQGFESVAAIFSALGFAALVVTFLLQLKELQLQRSELENQRHEMSRTQGELHRSAEADLRRLHVELLKMAIQDEELGAVWFEPSAETSSFTNRRQFWYANLIYQHQRVALELGGYTDEHAKSALRRLFKSPLMRDYWRNSAEPRATTLVAGTPEWRFAQIADSVYSEYHDDPPDHGLRLVE